MMNPAMMNKIRKMQKELIETQKRLEATEFVCTAGGGMVKVTVLGNKSVLKVDIDREAVTGPEDLEMVEDTIVAALNDAFNKVDKETERVLAPLQSGLGGFGF
jgi:DNA-binding YbaB/EbfC family protein